MSETRNAAQDLQDEILKTVRKSQEAVIDAIRTWADTVQSIAPKLPNVSMPLADKLPKPEEVVASAYDFAEQLLACAAEVRGRRAEGDPPPCPGQGQRRQGQPRRQVSWMSGWPWMPGPATHASPLTMLSAHTLWAQTGEELP